MPKTLLLFLLSPNVDAYINVIAHAYDQLDIREIHFIHIKGTKTALEDSEASTVHSRILTQVEYLSQSRYMDFFRNQTREIESVPAIDIYRRINRQIKERGIRYDVQYHELKEKLEAAIKSSGKENCFVDLTTATKTPAIDIFSICLGLDIKVYTFELDDAVDRQVPENSLYHNLVSQNSYSYTCLSESLAVQASQRLLVRRDRIRFYLIGFIFIVTATLLTFYFLGDAQSLPLQFVGVLANIIGVFTFIFEVVRRK